MNKFKKIYCGASFVFACIVIVFTITLSFANPVTTYAASSKSGKSTQSDNRDVADALGLSTATVSKVISRTWLDSPKNFLTFFQFWVLLFL